MSPDTCLMIAKTLWVVFPVAIAALMLWVVFWPTKKR